MTDRELLMSGPLRRCHQANRAASFYGQRVITPLAGKPGASGFISRLRIDSRALVRFGKHFGKQADGLCG